MRKQSAEIEVLSEEGEVKVVEEDLQNLKMELAAAQVSMHPQEVMQVAKGVFPEEEEVEVEEEKLDVTDVTSWYTELMSAQKIQEYLIEMKLLHRLKRKQQQ